MQKDRIAIGFSNGLGNFVLMTAALKILRNRGHKNIDMITDISLIKNCPSTLSLANKLFDRVLCNYNPEDYDTLYWGDWSCPINMIDKKDAVPNKILWSDSKTPHSGMHEVQVYLDMIGATHFDFDGFSMPLAKEPDISHLERPIICFANASSVYGSRRGSKVGWYNGFFELSKALVQCGCSVVLLGSDKSEIPSKCYGTNFIGKLNILQTAKVINQCDLMVCTDTGLMHVADALKIPVILLSGPTPVTKSHPILSKFKVVRSYIPCAPCFQTGLWKTCESPSCMNSIKVEDVLKEIFNFEIWSKSKDELKLVRLGGRGDLLNTLPLLYALKRNGHSIKYYTMYPEIMENQPCVDEIVKISNIEEAYQDGAKNLSYLASDNKGSVCTPHVMSEYNETLDALDLNVPFIFTAREKIFIENLKKEKFICLSNEHSNWSPTKSVVDTVFYDIFDYLEKKNIKTYFIGSDKFGISIPSWIEDLRGKTSIRESMCYVAAAYSIISLPGFFACVARHTHTPILLLHSGHASPQMFRMPWGFHAEPEKVCDLMYCAKKTCNRSVIDCQPSIDNIVKILDNVFFPDLNIGYAMAFHNRINTTLETLKSFRDSKPIKGDFIILDDASLYKEDMQRFLASYKVEGINVTYSRSNFHSSKIAKDVNPWVTLANMRLSALLKKADYDFFVLLDDDCLFHPFWIQKAVAVYNEARKEKDFLSTITSFEVYPVYGNFESEETQTVYDTCFGQYRIKDGIGGINYIIPNSFMKTHGFFNLTKPGNGGDTKKAKELLSLGFHPISLVPSMIQHTGHWRSDLKRSRIGDISQSF